MVSSTILETNKIIIDSIKHNLSLFESFDNVYLFGSVLKNKTPNDIDLLLIYAKRTSFIFDDLNIICTVLEKLCGLPIDLTVLSCEEERDTKFLKRINLYLKLK